MYEEIVHPFEAGRRGKPDELECGMAHLIGSFFLDQAAQARFDLRVAGRYDFSRQQPVVRISGEISPFLFEIPRLETTIAEIVREYYHAIQCDNGRDVLSVELALKPQSGKLASNGQAGDSGNPMAVAYRGSPNHLPWERYLAVELRDILDIIFQHQGKVPEPLASASGVAELMGLKADGKVQVNARYADTSLARIDKIVMAVEHDHSLTAAELREKIGRIMNAQQCLAEEKYDISFQSPAIVVNGAEEFYAGGWKVDEGNREAKPQREWFGSHGVMEDSGYGEDPSKPSATGTFMARHIAVNIVGQGLAEFARVALTYTIGQEEVDLNITTQGTGKLPQEKLEEWARLNFPLSIPQVIAYFGLRDPVLYRKIVQSADFFHNPEFPWNRVETFP